MPRPALFLDRDGVINVDRGYVHHADQFEFMPGIFELVRYAGSLGCPVVVVSNQSGIGRGYFDESTYTELTRWMCGRFDAENAPLARVYHCPYHPVHGLGKYRVDHPWRKPRPGMILQAACDLDLDLGRSAIVGDSVSDIEAAAAAGIALRIRLGSPQAGGGGASHEVAANLADALVLLRSRFSKMVQRP